ncbi:hypothetical protein I5907_18300 [Panacibacter sp. DH6]|uniref:Uncharacterized protein n=1 Tax=Panacibacter microcysteis TaxID=2793269 RepID=A0A931GZF4_9BACT|nr:hypothetical protein [Panacibacter microcysteis]MBG9378196.1 hypothetical protein [Panacibacter microcysteis]
MKHIQQAFIVSAFKEMDDLAIQFTETLTYLKRFDTINKAYSDILFRSLKFIAEIENLGFTDIEFQETCFFNYGFSLQHKISWNMDRKAVYIDGYIAKDLKVHFREFNKRKTKIDITEHTSLNGHSTSKELISIYDGFLSRKEEFHEKQTLIVENNKLNKIIERLKKANKELKAKAK